MARLKKSKGLNRVDLLNQVAFEYIANDNEKANEYCQQAIELAAELDYDKGRGKALIYKGVNEYLSGEFEDSHRDLKLGLSLVSGDRELEAYAFLQLGNSFNNQTLLDSSLFFYEQSYELLKDSANPTNLSKLYKNMATLYGLHSDPQRQIAYLKRSLRIRELLGDEQLLADLLVELGRLYAQSLSCDTANAYLGRAEDLLGRAPEDRDNLSDLRQARALCTINEGQFTEAFALLDSALTYFNKAGLAMKAMTLHMDIGAMFFNRGEYELALKNYYAALRIAQSKNYYVQQQDIEVGLGRVHYELGELEIALELATKSVAAARERKLPGRLGNSLTLMGVTLTQLRRFEQADKVLHEVLTISKEAGVAVKISEAYFNLGYLKEQEGEYKTAGEYYVRSRSMAIAMNYRLGMAWSLLGLGNIALKEKRYADASAYLAQTEGIASALNANQILIRVYTAQRDLLKAEGLWKESLQYAIRADELKDSVHRGDLTRRFANLEKMNEIEKRDQNIRVLEQERLLAQEKIQLQQAALRQNFIVAVAAVIAGLLLAVIAFVYARYYFRVKKLNRTINQNNDSITMQAQRLTDVNQELEKLNQALSEKTNEIQTQSEELTESHQRISALNESLQQRVIEKTHDLIRANEELLKQNSELQQFSYSLSHNLRGPVARIMGLAALIQQPGREPEAKNLTDLLLRTTNDLDQVLRDLSRIIDNKNELHRIKESVDLKLEWDKCVDFLRDSVPAGSTIEGTLEGLPPAFTVRAIVHSVLINLLSNSIKYRMPERHLKVSITARNSNLGLAIRFEDNGMGLDLDRYGDSVFKLFKRFHNHVEGRGMGLYLIKTQIDSLNGSIQIDSAVGAGTRFEIFLPDVFREELETRKGNAIHS